MPSVHHVVESVIPSTFRAASVQGMFDLPSSDVERIEWNVDLPLDFEWQIGAIVGPSGVGKSTIAKAMFGDSVVDGFDWGAPCMLDDFPAGMTPQDISGLLTSVGFNSIPAWLRPYRVLSTGQKARADLARALASDAPLVVYDEFTSVVDRVVAKSICVSLSKWLRRQSARKFIAVSCHRDFLPWLEADWVYDMEERTFARGRLQRPRIDVNIYDSGRIGHQVWPTFHPHHYMTGDLARSARVFLATVTMDGEERLAGFFGVGAAMGLAGWRRGHRTVVLPDFQGIGIGNRMIEAVAEQLWERQRVRFRATTASPSIIKHRLRHPDMWVCINSPQMNKPSRHAKTSAGRLTTTWAYVPEALR